MAKSPINFEALSTQDLEAYTKGNWDGISDAGLHVISGTPYGTLETLGRAIEREAGSSIRGIAEFLGYTPDAAEYEADFKREQEYRAMQETNTGAAITGGLLGSVLDPTNLIPIGTAKTVGQFVKQGALVGGITGLLQPTYDEFQDSKAFNTASGVIGGGLIGGGLGTLVKKIEGKTGTELADELVKTAQDNLNAAASPSAKPRYKAGYVDSEGNLIPIDTPTSAPLRQDDTPAFNAPADQAQKQVNYADLNSTPRLPSFLGDFAPKYGKTALEFNNDIDKALYILGNPKVKYAKSADYMSWATKSLGMSEPEVMKLAKEAHTEINNKAKGYLIDQGTKGFSPDMVTAVPIKFTKALDKIINPVTKHLDEESKMVYNYGNALMPDPNTGKLRIKMSDPGFKGFLDSMKQIKPDISSQDAVLTARGYSRLLNHMKEEYGANFTSRNIRDFINDQEYNMDAFLVAAKRGDFDGCPV